jgi:heme A synthase
LLLTVHKLLALAALILMAITVIRINRATPLATAALVAAAATAVCFVVAIISGGLVSTDKPAPALARALHWVTPFVTIAGAAVTYFLLP